MASGDSLFSFNALHGSPPSTTAAAVLDRTGYDGHWVQKYVDTETRACDFYGVMPAHYGGGGVTLEIHFKMNPSDAGTKPGDIRLDAQFERKREGDHDFSINGFAAVQSVTVAKQSDDNNSSKATIVFSDGAQMDSIAAGDPFRLRVLRDHDHADDDSGEAWLLDVYGTET